MVAWCVFANLVVLVWSVLDEYKPTVFWVAKLVKPLLGAL